ncbi:MAG: hypothetical protein K2Q26_04305 [Bdellovibrionales bacterium]|nr:hypothetical protein [Bdellovibrionales bacterium]
MNFGVGFLFLLSFVLGCNAFAASGEVFYEPVPSFTTSRASLDLLDADLQSQLVRYSAQKRKEENVYYDWAPQENVRVYRDSFILKRFMDKSARGMIKAGLFQGTFLEKTADRFKDGTQTGIKVYDEKDMPHRFDFRFEAFQGFAQIQYTGFTKAKLRYDMDDARLMMVFEHSLSTDKTIAIETALTGAETSQYVMLNCRW